MIFDSHAHYDSEQFDIDRDELLGSVPVSYTHLDVYKRQRSHSAAR